MGINIELTWNWVAVKIGLNGLGCVFVSTDNDTDAWWDFAGVPDDVTYFICNVNPVFVMTDWARGTDKSPKSANPL